MAEHVIGGVRSDDAYFQHPAFNNAGAVVFVDSGVLDARRDALYTADAAWALKTGWAILRTVFVVLGSNAIKTNRAGPAAHGGCVFYFYQAPSRPRPALFYLQGDATQTMRKANDDINRILLLAAQGEIAALKSRLEDSAAEVDGLKAAIRCVCVCGEGGGWCARSGTCKPSERARCTQVTCKLGVVIGGEWYHLGKCSNVETINVTNDANRRAVSPRALWW